MPTRTLSFEAIGTRWSISVTDDLTDDAWRQLNHAIRDRIEHFDRTYSRFRNDSLVTRIANHAGTYDLPNDTAPLLDFYHRLYTATDGLMTPLIGNALSDAGYDAQYSLHQTGPLHQPFAWPDVLSHTGSTLMAKQPVLLDFGGAGKGYLVDIISELISATQIGTYTIDAGGDILHRTLDGTPVTIGLENPIDHTEAIGTVELHNASLCASSGSRRRWGGYHHILNPRTLQSPTDVIATWVVASDTITADGLATALFFVEPHSLHEFAFDYAILRHDMSMKHSKNMPIRLFGEEDR